MGAKKYHWVCTNLCNLFLNSTFFTCDGYGCGCTFRFFVIQRTNRIFVILRLWPICNGASAVHCLMGTVPLDWMMCERRTGDSTQWLFIDYSNIYTILLECKQGKLVTFAIQMATWHGILSFNCSPPSCAIPCGACVDKHRFKWHDKVGSATILIMCLLLNQQLALRFGHVRASRQFKLEFIKYPIEISVLTAKKRHFYWIFVSITGDTSAVRSG